ncbi:MAG: carbon starvation protein A, partial [Bacteroidales bacterium]|nr:carbon starvation protein A [Bacteroidales bacterium]
NQGKTIGDLTGDIISPATRYAFQFIMQFLLFIVLSVFAMIVGLLFVMYPESVLPVWMQIPIAVWLGWEINKGKNDLVYSIIAVVLLYISVIAGTFIPITIPSVLGSSVTSWTLILFIYVYFASTIPVHKLLQPRDFINSYQLIISMGLLFIGLVVAHPVITAPAINSAAYAADTDIPGLMPLLFITIACGAISGFHSLASSGTTVKQVNKEKDTLIIGYGSMIMESILAVLVLMAIAGGLGMGLEKNGIVYTGLDAFNQHYQSWSTASGLGAKLEAFVVGSANLLSSYGVPAVVGKSIIAVFIVSFANTTLDSATRIQRLSLQEIFKSRKGKVIKPFDNRYITTFIVVLAALLMTLAKPAAEGALILWPLFGSLNQLLAALALGIVTVYLYQKGKSILYTFLPMIAVLFVTVWSMINNIVSFIEHNDVLLIVFSLIVMLLTLWLIISSVYSVFVKKMSKLI